MQIGLGIVGCGLIGKKRALALPVGAKVTACLDVDSGRAESLAKEVGARTVSSVSEMIGAQVDGVIIAAVNSELVRLSEQFLAAGIPALIEKPAARSIHELETLCRYTSVPVKIGFNHRFHPAFLELRKEIESRPEDPILFIDAKYGNGARLGFEKEWRSSVDIAGGGELLDQGVHILDLASCLVGELSVAAGHCRTHYWKMDVDDNAWAILSTERGQTVSMHVSSTEWKNCFVFEVYTRSRKYAWNGLGRSYGPETLTTYSMKPEMGVPDTDVKTYPAEDNSWLLENSDFVQGLARRTAFNGDLEDGIRVLRLVESIYQKSFANSAGAPHPRWYQAQ